MARTTGSDGAKTEDAIRKAAIDLIAAQGFAAVTLRDLARHVGIQAGSLYRYFPSKETLLLTIMTKHMEELISAWERAAPDTDSPVTLLNAFIDFHVHYHAQKPKEVFIANMELRSLEANSRRIVSGYRDRYEKILRSILQNGVDCGAFSDIDVRVSAFAILAMLTGMTTWYREGGRLTREEVATRYKGLIFDGLKRRSPKARARK